MNTETRNETFLPVLPLRDVVVYPNMVIPLFVGRDRSMKALDAAMAKRLAQAVPVERYAAALGDVILRPRLPRQWCASI